MVTKTSKKVLSIVLAVMLLASVLVMSSVNSLNTVNAATGDTVYFESSDWTAPNCYMWKGASTSNSAWPGVAMQKVEGNIWSYELDGDYENIIFNNGGSQTDDMVYPGADQIYNQSTGAWSEYAGASSVSVKVSEEDGKSFADTLSVTLTLKNAISGTYTIDDGETTVFTDTATVVLGTGLKAGLETKLTVTATGEEDYSKTYTYKKSFRKPSAGSSGEDGHTTDALDGNYGTNTNGVGGKDKTISSASDWNDSMLIAQGVANDDANVFKGPHEYPVYDTYSLYGAWDNDYVYIGWQFVNVRDVTASDQGGACTNEAKPYNADMPQMIALDLGKGKQADGTMDVAGEYVWGETIEYTTNIDAVMAFSSKPGVGQPSLFMANDDGKFSYDTGALGFKVGGISYEYENGFFGSSMMGIGGNGYTGYTPDQVLTQSGTFVDFKSEGHKESLDTLYTMKIPYDALEITKADLESNGIGVMHIGIYGSSAVNTIPMDPSCLDKATDSYSADASSTAEKEDTDVITVPLARIGHELSAGSTGPKPLSANFGANVSSPQPTSKSITLSADGYNGTAPYTYAFSANGASLPANGNTCTWTPQATGIYTIKCVVTDASGTSVTETKTFEIGNGGTIIPTQPTQPTQPTAPTTDPSVEYTIGDVSGDGVINILDSMQIQAYTSQKISFTASQQLAADINKDGIVTIADAFKLQQYLVQIVTVL